MFARNVRRPITIGKGEKPADGPWQPRKHCIDTPNVFNKAAGGVLPSTRVKGAKTHKPPINKLEKHASFLAARSDQLVHSPGAAAGIQMTLVYHTRMLHLKTNTATAVIRWGG